MKKYEFTGKTKEEAINNAKIELQELEDKLNKLEETIEKIVNILEITYEKFNELVNFDISLKDDLELVYSNLFESGNK